MAEAIGWAGWVIVVGYALTVLMLGGAFGLRRQSAERFFVGDRSVPGWAAGLSLFASAISTTTFIAYPGHGYGGDWTLLLQCFMLPVAAVFLTVLIIPFYRRVVRLTAYEFLEQRFGYGVRAYASLVFIAMRVFRMGFVLFLVAKAIGAMTGWDLRIIIVVSGAVTILYTAVGGLQAVIWTDVLQSFALLGGGVACLVAILVAADGGPGELFSVAADAGKFRLADLTFSLQRPTWIVMSLFGVVAYVSDYCTSQEHVQRYLAVSSTRAARRGVWLGATSCLVTWTLFMLIGTMLYSFYQLHPGELPAAVAADQEKVFPYFVMTRLPGVLIGLLLVAMCAAAMSSLDTVINSLAMVTVCDLYARVRPEASDQTRVALAKMLTVFWGVVGTVVALRMIHVEEALKFSFTMVSILGGGRVGVFLLGFVARRAHAVGVYVGIAAGVPITAWGAFDQVGLSDGLGLMHFPFHEWMLIVCSNAAAFIVGYTASLLIPPRDPARASGPTLWDVPASEDRTEP